MPRGGSRPGAGRKKRSDSPSVDAPAPSDDLKKAAPANRTPSGQFLPGQPGNPSGRPRGERAYLVEKYGEDARPLHEQLDKLVKNKKTPPHVKADILKWKVDRHSGKAPQTVEHTGEGGGPVEVRFVDA